MKIVKHGKFVECGFPIECPRCGCVFELNREEFINSLYINPTDKKDTKLKHYCPECNLLVIYLRPHLGFIQDIIEDYKHPLWTE